MASHGSDTPTSPRAILHHTDTILCTFMHTTVIKISRSQNKKLGNCQQSTVQGPLNIWTEHSNCQIHSREDSKIMITLLK